MNNKVAVLMPTIHRPHKMKENVENLYDVTPKNMIDIVFIVEKDDIESIKMARTLDAITLINQRSRNFGGAMNTAVRTLIHKYFFGGSDDFYFHQNWLPPLLELSKNYGMVGANDLGNPDVQNGTLSTCYLIKRSYLSKCVADSPLDIVHEGYLHNFTDTELTETAIANGQYKYCSESFVEHMHPAWGKAEIDRTYKLQDGTWDHDVRLFNSRRHLWQK